MRLAMMSRELLNMQMQREQFVTIARGGTTYPLLTNGGTQEVKVIPKGDIYRLIVKAADQSKNKRIKEKVERFENWIFDEVLVSIDEHGAYMTPDTLDSMIASPDFGIRLLTALKDEQDKNRSLVAENEVQRQIIGELQPMADYVNHIMSSTGTMTAAQIGADYGMSANRLNRILHEERIQRKVNGQWVLYAEHMSLGYTKSETIPIVRSDGRPDTKMFSKWTQRGRLKINEVLNRRGIYANMDMMQSA